MGAAIVMRVCASARAPNKTRNKGSKFKAGRSVYYVIQCHVMCAVYMYISAAMLTNINFLIIIVGVAEIRPSQCSAMYVE